MNKNILFIIKFIIKLLFICLISFVVLPLLITLILYFHLKFDSRDMSFNKISDFNSNKYTLSYMTLKEGVVIDDNYVDLKWNYYIKSNIESKNYASSYLIKFVKKYKELNNKLYVLGVDPTECDNISTSCNYHYKYFVIDYNNDELTKYDSIGEMNSKDMQIVNDDNGWIFSKVD